MRLIDADELITTILTNDLCGDDNVDKAILNAPTVKAIPIDWINKWVITTNMGAGRTIDRLLEDWEKENATKVND